MAKWVRESDRQRTAHSLMLIRNLQERYQTLLFKSSGAVEGKGSSTGGNGKTFAY